ncbi:hypothetical protein DFP72DRAFT_1075230 [Ephemerocybe angulata]|uniref:BTB domain-containing protein n=1 Tax=Ephemerocybe angulata TaxID=980116 RepID=A0A8H6HJL9_9AGAR|nr:hypothetical protein DFP72DRAFT_1075230 [Tulosesus angulatus]
MAKTAESAGLPSTTSDPSLVVDHKTVYFEVEGLVYHVCRYGFETYSLSVFRDMFALPQGSHEESAVEGATRENPIKLPGCTTSEFQSLIQVLYPRQLSGPPTLTKEAWTGVLKVARLWDMPAVAKVAIEKLSTMDLKPVEKIRLGKEYWVPTWLEEGYITLVDDPSMASKDEMETLGWDTIYKIFLASNQVTKRLETDRGRLWDRVGKLYCGYCALAQQGGYHREVSDPQTVCGTCSRIPAESGYGVIVSDPTALSALLPQVTRLN